MNQKGFAPILIILGVILLLGLAGGAYYFGQANVKAPPSQVPVSNSQTSVSPTQPITKTTISPTPTVDETANWKTYISDKQGFSFKYPPSLKINLAPTSDFYNRSLLLSGSMPEGGPNESGNIKVKGLFDIQTASTVKDLLGDSPSGTELCADPEYMRNLSKTIILVDGKTANLKVGQSDLSVVPKEQLQYYGGIQTGDRNSYCVSVTEKPMEVRWTGDIDALSLQDFKLIISTIKFLN